MRTHYDGLCGEANEDFQRSQHHLGGHGSVDQKCLFSSIEKKLPIDKLAKLYIDENFSRHGVLLSIVSDKR